MGFIIGFIVGIIFTIIALVLLAKPITRFAAKRSMPNLFSGVQRQVNEFAESMDNPTFEDNNVKENKQTKNEE